MSLTKKDSHISREISDNQIAQMLFGEHSSHLKKLEAAFDVLITERGNHLKVTGSKQHIAQVDTILDALLGRINTQKTIAHEDIEDLIRLTLPKHSKISEFEKQKILIHTYKKTIQPKSKNQQAYLETLSKNDVAFGIGPAGTGKTYLSVAYAVAQLKSGTVDRIVITRPVVEAGENLGFLPGDLKEKIDPYLRPIYDALHDMMPAEELHKRMEVGDIEIAPLAYMRGRSLNHAFVILDEAQNTTMMQMKMFLTRLGKGSQMAINGDISQIDLPGHVPSGLIHASKILHDVSGIAITYFDRHDVVRHPIIAKIIDAYEENA